MQKQKWIFCAVAAVLLAALVMGLLVLTGVWKLGPEQVALCLRQGSGSPWSEYHDLLEQTLTGEDYAVERCIAGNDQSVQTQQVQDLLKKGYRFFVIEPVMTSGTENLLQLLQNAEAKAVFINYRPEQLEQYPNCSFVGFDPEQAGQLQAQLALDVFRKADVNDDGHLSYGVLDTAQENKESQLRQQSAMDTLGGTCLEVRYAKSGVQTAQQQCRLLLSSYGRDLEIILCGDDVLALGALAAAEDGGRIPGEDIFIFGANATTESRNLVRQGKLSGTLQYDMQTASRQVVQLLRSDEQVIYMAGYLAVDSKNAE